MTKIKSISSGDKRGKIVGSLPRGKVIDPNLVAEAFGARHVGSSKGLDLFSIKQTMEKILEAAEQDTSQK